MRSSFTTKIIAAIAAALIADATDKVLDSVGMSEERAKLAREVTKAIVVAIATLLIESALSDSSKADMDAPFYR